MSNGNPMMYNEGMQPLPPANPKKTGLRTAVILLGLLLLGLIVCHMTWLRIKTVTVVGNTHVSRSEILELAGLNRQVSFLNVREKDIAEGIDSHIRLSFVQLEKTFPDALTIYVDERIPCTSIVIAAGQYLLDDEGFVLEKSDAINYDNGLVHLTGMNVKRLNVGETLLPVDADQLSAYQAVVGELLVQDCVAQFSELNVAKPDNLYLVSVDGYTIDLGDESDMRAKLLTVRGVLNYLRENGYDTGELDATVPGYATYSPPGV